MHLKIKYRSATKHVTQATRILVIMWLPVGSVVVMWQTSVLSSSLKTILNTVLETDRYMPVYHTGTSFCSWITYPHINIYIIYPKYIFFPVFLTVYPCFAFKKSIGTSKFPFRVLTKYVLYLPTFPDYGCIREFLLLSDIVQLLQVHSDETNDDRSCGKCF
jgi:hypothetical protein